MEEQRIRGVSIISGTGAVICTAVVAARSSRGKSWEPVHAAGRLDVARRDLAMDPTREGRRCSLLVQGCHW
jgi:hypothetical protein